MRLHFKIEAFEARIAIDEDLDDLAATGLPDEVEHDDECECLVCELPRARAELKGAHEVKRQIREELSKAQRERDDANARAVRAERKAAEAPAVEMERTANGRLANGVEMNRLRDENARLQRELREAREAGPVGTFRGAVQGALLDEAAQNGAPT